MLSHGQGERAHLRPPATSRTANMNEMRSPGPSPPSLDSLNHEILKETCNAMAAGMRSAGSGYYRAKIMVLCATRDESEYAPADLAGSAEAAKPRRSQFTQKSEARPRLRYV